jgi:hypothetical protein
MTSTNNIIPFKAGNDNDQTPDVLTAFFYLLFSHLPSMTVELLIANAKSGNISFDNTDLYNYAKKLATKVSPTP